MKKLLNKKAIFIAIGALYIFGVLFLLANHESLWFALSWPLLYITEPIADSSEDLLLLPLNPIFWIIVAAFVGILAFLFIKKGKIGSEQKSIPVGKWRPRILSIPFIVLFLLLLTFLVNGYATGLEQIRGWIIAALLILGATAIGVWLAKLWAYISGLAIALLVLVGGLLIFLYVMTTPCEGFGCWGIAFLISIVVVAVAIGIPTVIFLWFLIKERLGFKKAWLVFFALLALTIVFHGIVVIKPYLQEQEIVKLVGENRRLYPRSGFEEKGSRSLEYDKRVVAQEFYAKNPFPMTLIASKTVASSIPSEFRQYQGVDIASVGKEVDIKQYNGYYYYSSDTTQIMMWVQDEKMFRIECRCNNGIGEAGLIDIAEAVSSQW